MKKIRFALCLLAAVLLCLLSCAALAETKPVNPYFKDARIEEAEAQMSTFGMLTAQIDCVQAPTFNAPGVWKMNVSGATGQYTCEVYICDDQYYTEGYLNTNAMVNVGSDGTFSYQCVAPGEYTIYARVSDGRSMTRVYEYFTMKADAAHPSIDETIQKIARQCIAAGCKTDYEKALWLHDYLIDNADYDYSYTYYSVDGVLLRGTGVCDSYRKAYEKLLHAVGVDAVSVDGDNHAWNMVKLGGEWSNVDVTWDESKYEGVYYRYSYFGLPTELMEVDHTFETCPRECTSYDQHYFIHSGYVSLWSDKYVNSIKSSLNSGEWSFALDAPIPYTVGGNKVSWEREHIVYGMTAYALEKSGWAVNGLDVEIEADYVETERTEEYIKAEIRFEVNLDDRTLNLPAGLTSIEASAFTGDEGFMAVVIPDGAKSIGSKAFSGCENLWKVVIPDSVTKIADDAFKGCDMVTVVCSSGSEAYRFAQAKELRTLIG